MATLRSHSLTVLLLTVITMFVMLAATSCRTSQSVSISNESIRIDERSPWYWNYKGKTTLLLGGSWQDNLFNHPGGLEDHLDVMLSVGGNYVRNTMSHRNVGNVFAYARNEDGLFDLEAFNDEYWNRFSNFLRMTYERNIIVQIEIWDPWDLYIDHQSFGGWSHNPFNPANNINYTSEESGLPEFIHYSPTGEPSPNPFFRTVPALDNNALVLAYQQSFVNKMLSFSLQHPHVLYCMHNETGERVEVGDYWAAYVREQAEQAGRTIYITDMRRNELVRSADHTHIFDRPELYTFVDISQNNAFPGIGQGHYDNILWVKERIGEHPRPVNNNKNYGSFRHGDEESVARMGRIIFAGCASARFHRPHPIEDPAGMYETSDFGLGLSPRAQKIIQSLRMATNKLDMALVMPMNELLSDREDNEAYLLAEAGKQYALYFPDGGSVSLNMSGASGDWHYQWINIDEAQWSASGQMQAEDQIRITSPGNGHWVVVILPE